MKTDLFRLLSAVAILAAGSISNWAAAQDVLDHQERPIAIKPDRDAIKPEQRDRAPESIAIADDWKYEAFANDFASDQDEAAAPVEAIVVADATKEPAAFEPMWAVAQDPIAEIDSLQSDSPQSHRSFFTSGRGRFFAGSEILAVRPHFSEATAYILRRDAVTANNVTTSSDEWIYYDYDYELSARAYFGYRLEDCCSEIRFTYWNLNGSDSQSATTNAAGTVYPTYFVIQPGANDTLTATSDVEGHIFDLDLSRCIPLGDECQSCNSCPRWDLRWSAGVRIANMGYDTNVSTNDATDGNLDITMDFVGAGPKIGLEGRRYFGNAGQFSVYSTLDFAMLLGQYEHSLVRTTGANPTVIETFTNNATRIIPVTEIEIGSSWSPTDHLTFSAGWFFQAWWDLGMSEQQTSTQFGGGAHFMNDDSNIMAWDGITLRAEYQF